MYKYIITNQQCTGGNFIPLSTIRASWFIVINTETRQRKKQISHKKNDINRTCYSITNTCTKNSTSHDKKWRNKRVGYLGHCHSRAWFEPWLQLCALSPTTRPTAVMQLPCIKSRLPCNLQTETKQRKHLLTHQASCKESHVEDR